MGRWSWCKWRIWPCACEPRPRVGQGARHHGSLARSERIAAVPSLMPDPCEGVSVNRIGAAHRRARLAGHSCMIWRRRCCRRSRPACVPFGASWWWSALPSGRIAEHLHQHPVIKGFSSWAARRGICRAASPKADAGPAGHHQDWPRRRITPAIDTHAFPLVALARRFRRHWRGGDLVATVVFVSGR